jgi:chromosome partitioning protein
MTEIVEKRRPFAITIANGKGGIGKTTTALAIGTILARRGLKVLLVDLDPQGNLTLSLGLKPHKLPLPPDDMPTAGTLFAGDSFHTKHENIHLVFARSLIVDNAYQLRVNTGDDSFFLGQDLSIIRSLPYDYVIFDCPPSIGKIISNTVFASDFLIIPTLAEHFSANAVMDMMRLLDTLRESGKGALPYRILITLFEKRNRIHKHLKDELRITYGSRVFETIIEADIALRKAAIFGFPMDDSHGVIRYRQLVDELMDTILGEQKI